MVGKITPDRFYSARRDRTWSGSGRNGKKVSIWFHEGARLTAAFAGTMFTSKKGMFTMKQKMIRLFLCLMAGMVLATCAGAAAEEAPATAVRTILMYGCGSNLETFNGFLTWNLQQILGSDIAPETNFLVLTGGALEWQTEAEYLEGAEKIGETQPVQLWRCSGRNAANAENGHGKMTLLDSWPAELSSASMSNGNTLKAFLDIAAKEYPAEMYDLILWDHGGGPELGFGLDELYEDDGCMSVGAIARAIQQSAVERLDILNFDACLMASAEVAATLGGFTDYLVFSSETEPGYGQEYSGWLNALAQDPRMNGFELGKRIVDAFVAFYSDEEQRWFGQDGTLSVVNTANFRERMTEPLTRLAETGEKELTTLSRENWKFNYYDELNASRFTYKFEDRSLCDLASLSDTLGICRTEMDNDSDWFRLTNAYTEVTEQVERILEDRDGSGDDVLYSGHTGSTVRTNSSEYFFVRNEEGELVHANTWAPSGLSIFYDPTDTSQTLRYSSAIDEMIAMVQDEPTRAMLEACRRTALRGLMVYETGRTVDELLESGDRDVFYKDIRNSWIEKRDLTSEEIEAYKEQMHIKAEITGMKSAKWDEYIGLVIRTLDEHSALDTESWLAAVAAQQAIESVASDRAKATGVDKNGDGVMDGYRVTVDSPMNLVKDVSLIISADLEVEEGYESLLSEGAVVLGKVEGTPATEGFLNALYESATLGYAAEQLYKQEFTTYDVPTAVETWYEIRDGEGKGHVICVGDVDPNYETELNIPAEMVLTKIDEFGENEIQKGYLQYSGGRFTGFLDIFFGDRPVPLSDPIFDGATLIPCSCEYIDLGFIMWPVYFKLSDGFQLNAEADRGMSLVMTPLDEIQDLKGKKLRFDGVITDLYRYEHRIGKVLEAVDPNGELIRSIEQAEVTAEPIRYDGNPHKAKFTVTYGGKELERETDYEVLAEIQTEAGEYKAVIFGKGDYVGYQMTTFTISAAEE